MLTWGYSIVGTLILAAEGSLQEHPGSLWRHSHELTPWHESLLELHLCDVVLCWVPTPGKYFSLFYINSDIYFILQAVDEFVLSLAHKEPNAEKWHKLSALSLHDDKWTCVRLFCNILQVCDLMSQQENDTDTIQMAIGGDSMWMTPNKCFLRPWHQCCTMHSLPSRRCTDIGRNWPPSRVTRHLS